jgi:hypothetical protein
LGKHKPPCDEIPQAVFALQPFGGIDVEDIKLFLSNQPPTRSEKHKILKKT